MATAKYLTSLITESSATPGFEVLVLNPSGNLNVTYDAAALTNGLSPVARVSVGDTTLTLTGAHCGKLIVLAHASAGVSISIGPTGVLAEFTCAIRNKRGTDYTMPTPAGSGAALEGPANGDLKLKNNGIGTILVDVTTVCWRGESAP